MSNLKIYDDSKNYTAQVIKLPVMTKVTGLDNLMCVNVQGNDCLVDKNYDPNVLYLFFPAECQLSHDFVAANNLYRHNDYNSDKTKKGFFEDNRRVKAVKFKGVVSTGFVIPLTCLEYAIQTKFLILGDEFNAFGDIEICKKYYKKPERKTGMSNPKTRVIDEIVDSRYAPEHLDTIHLLKNVHKLKLDDIITVTYKLHGTSARYFNTLVKRKLSRVEKLARYFGANVKEEDYQYITASRRVVKSVGFEELPYKNHYFTTGDLWSEVGKEHFDGKLHQGEAIYCEIIGKTYKGEAIQHGYTYGLEKPEVYIYRISNISSQGIEVDLPYDQMVTRASQIGVDTCPIFFHGPFREFVLKYYGTFNSIAFDDRDREPILNKIFYETLLEKPSILDSSVVEEGFCIRMDKYPKPEIFKIKSKAFLLHEGHQVDKEVVNIEDEQTVTQ